VEISTNTGATEEYNGSTWTTGGTMNTARYQLGGTGTQTAALAFGGRDPVSNATEEYDGSSWTTNPAIMNTARDMGNGRNKYISFICWWKCSTCNSSNRRIYRCRSSSNKNNYSKLTGGKYGTYKNIHRS
jgi:hypothetical protein